MVLLAPLPLAPRLVLGGLLDALGLGRGHRLPGRLLRLVTLERLHVPLLARQEAGLAKVVWLEGPREVLQAPLL